VIARSLTARLAASVIAAGMLLTSATGCTLISTQATYLPYDPADGIGADLGDVAIRDMRAVLADNGSALAFVFAAINEGQKGRTVTLVFTGDGGETTSAVYVGANQTVLVGDPSGSVKAIVEQPGPIVPGQNVEVYVQAGDADGVQLTVPVFDSTNPLYTEFAPNQSAG